MNKITSFFTKIKKYSSAHKAVAVVSVIILISLISYVSGRVSGTSTVTQYVFGRVTKGDLVVSVTGTGQVATLSEVDIKPQTTGQTQTLGQIISVKVKNGDIVNAGQIVAILDGKTTLQSLNQATANVESAQANYDKLVNGPTASDLQSINDSIQNSKISIENQKQNILIGLQNAYTSAANAVYLNTDPLFQNPMSISAQLAVSGVSFTNQQLVTNVNDGRVTSGKLLQDWKAELNPASSTSDLNTLLTSAISRLNTIRSYFDDMTSLFASYSVSVSAAGQTSINSDKGIASSARASMDSSISSLTSSSQSYVSALNSLDQNQQSYNLKIAPPAQSDVIVAKSQLDNAKAALATAQQNYASRIITAPFDGQIGGLTAQVGMQVSSSDSLGKIITPDKVVNVTLNEVDAAKVSKGNAVSLTFDALSGVTIPGHISFVDPLGTVSQGVVSYAVQIAMDQQNDQIKTGMTATAEITTQIHSAVLMIPSSAIMTRGSTQFVLVPDNVSPASTSTDMSANQFAFSSSTLATTSSSTRRFRNGTSTRAFGQGNFSATANTSVVQSTVHQVVITTGISNDTSTEIVSGLTEGETIVIRSTGVTSTKSAASAATTNARRGGVGGFGGASVGGAAIGGALR